MTELEALGLLITAALAILSVKYLFVGSPRGVGVKSIGGGINPR